MHFFFLKSNEALFLLFLLAALNACGQSLPPDLNHCAAQNANVNAGDGYFQIACGCSEAPGTTVASNQSLSCTVPTGTSVNFYFIKPKEKHQIVPVGTPSFAASQIVNGSSKSTVIFTVPFPSAGTYSFQDGFLPTLTGQIIVH